MKYSGKKQPKIKADELFVTWSDCGKGVWHYSAYLASWPAPLGSAWIMGLGSQTDKGTALLMDSYVHEVHRRRGIMSALCQTILTHYSRIRTMGNTKLGLAFLRGAKFKHYRELHEWVLFGKDATVSPK